MTYSVFIRLSPWADRHLGIRPHRKSSPRALAGLATLQSRHQTETACLHDGRIHYAPLTNSDEACCDKDDDN